MQAHYLRRNKQTRLPGHCIFFDTETYSGCKSVGDNCTVHKWRLGVAEYVRIKRGQCRKPEMKRFTDPVEFWLWAFSKAPKKGRLWIFAHNLAFDATVSNLWRLVSDKIVTLNHYVIEDPPTILSLSFNGRRIQCVDSMNYWPLSLKSIGEQIGLEKDTLPHASESEEVWFQYCQRDVAILRKFVLAYMANVRDCDLGNFSPTIAGQSMQAYRHRFMRHHILIHTDKAASEMERLSNRGGRILCGYYGEAKERVFHLDVNNLYPFVMGYGLFPARLICDGRFTTVDAAKGMIKDHGIVAMVKVRCNNHQYPLLTTDGVRYYSGSYCTCLCRPELKQALANDEIETIGPHFIYTLAPLFMDWSKYWLGQIVDARERNDKLSAGVAKMLANALSGKFAQKPIRWHETELDGGYEDFGTWAVHDRQTGKSETYRAVAGQTQIREVDKQTPEAFPLITAFITSYGRCHMDSLRATAGDKSVFYQDTDSLFVTKAGYERLKAAGECDQLKPGKLKLCGEYNYAVFHGHKRYQLNSDLIASGVKKSSVKVADGVYMQQTFQGARSILSTDPSGTIVCTDKRVELKPLTPPGTVDAAGWITPHVYYD